MEKIWRVIGNFATVSFAKIRLYGNIVFELFKQCAFALTVLLSVVIILEDFCRGRLESGAVYFLIDAHGFFNSSAGKPLLGPLLVVAGGVVGLLTTIDNLSGRFFWLEFSILSVSGLFLLWFLIQVSPPVVSTSVLGMLEVYGIKQDNNQLGGALSLCLVTLSAWLANRFRLKTMPSEKEES